MGRLRLWVVLAIVTGGCAVSAAAGVGPQQRTDPVTAVLAANRLAVPYERACAGDDGQYRQALETYGGTVSGDPRLTGSAMLVLTSFTNTHDGQRDCGGHTRRHEPDDARASLPRGCSGCGHDG